MTIQQQEICIETRKLYLTKGRLFKHFLDSILLSGISLFLLLNIGKGFIEKTGNYQSPYFLLFLIFPFFAFLIYFNKNRELRLKEIETHNQKSHNYKLVKETLSILGWHIKVDNKGFIEAYTDNFGIWTWTDQMISVLITDNKILFNSIGNVDTYATQGFSWGQNLRNIKQFRKTFELMATNPQK